jgi:hypothetical protein
MGSSQQPSRDTVSLNEIIHSASGLKRFSATNICCILIFTVKILSGE